MGNIVFLAAAGVILASLAFGESTSLGQCERTFEKALQPGANLRIQARSGDVDIVGWTDAKVVVSCQTDHGRNSDDVQVDYSQTSNSADLKVTGGPRDHFRLRIQIPDHTNLTVRCTAGDLGVSGITGDKDISLTAGDLTVDVGTPEDYARAEASVRAGDLNARPFGVNKGGLFRSFKRSQANGKYRLDVRLGAGDLTLK